MSENCPVCGSDAYDSKNRSCNDCGHYDEDYNKLKKREKRRNDRWLRNHKRR